MDLTNKVALITGGKRIGRSVAEALALRGADVMLTYARSRTEAEEAAARVQAASRRGAAIQADLSQAAAPHMRAQGGGRIINFSDWVARSGRPRYEGFLPYYVAKAGAIALTEALALELARDNILVNAIAPGPIVAPPGTTDEESRAVADATPLGRWGGEAEIAKTVLALVDSDFITGETL